MTVQADLCVWGFYGVHTYIYVMHIVQLELYAVYFKRSESKPRSKKFIFVLLRSFLELGYATEKLILK